MSRRRIALVVIGILVVLAAAATAVAVVALNTHTLAPVSITGPGAGGRFGGFGGQRPGEGFSASPAVTVTAQPGTWAQALWVGLTGFVLGAVCVAFFQLLLRGARPAPRVAYAGMPQPPSAATAELDMRYARGEVQRDEYLLRRGDLAGPAPVPTEPSKDA